MKEIIINNLSYSYSPQSKALDNISLSIERGSFVAFIGHNGSGKSTLSKALIRLVEADGEIIIGDVQLTKDSVSTIRRKIGIVFQNPDNQFVGATVEDDIAFGLENREIDPKDMKDMVLKAAKEVGMQDYLDKEPSRLSGGQKQRVAIAGVLAMHPEIIIFDEATSMLDAKGRNEVYGLLNKMREENPSLTVIIITHDVEETLLCDKIFLFSKGKIEAELTPDELYQNKELVEKHQLMVPFKYRLNEALKDKDIDLSTCKSVDEVVEVLCQYK